MTIFYRRAAQPHEPQPRGAARVAGHDGVGRGRVARRGLCARRRRAARRRPAAACTSIRSTPEFSGTTDYHAGSDYDARNVAVVRPGGWPLSERWGWSFGLRGEQRDADYQRSRRRATASRAAPTTIGNGHACGAGRRRCTSTRSDNLRLFTTVSRGYKAGGFNLGAGSDHAPTLRARIPVEPGRRREGRVARSAAVCRRHGVLYEAHRTCRFPPACSSIRSAIRAATSSTPTMLRAGAISASRAACAGGDRAVGDRRHARPAAHALLRLSARPARMSSDRDQAHAPEYQAVAERDLAASARLDGARRRSRRSTITTSTCRRTRITQRCVLADPCQSRLRSRPLGGVRLGPQRVRRGLRRARVLLRQRAAAVRRTSATCSSASRNSSESPPDGSFVDAYRNRDQPVSARCRLTFRRSRRSSIASTPTRSCR